MVQHLQRLIMVVLLLNQTGELLLLMQVVSQQEQTLAEFRRLLKPGGMLLLAESCQSFTESFLVRMLFRHPHGNQQSAETFLAEGCGLKTAAFPAETIEIELFSTVEGGLVDGVITPTTPHGAGSTRVSPLSPDQA